MATGPSGIGSAPPKFTFLDNLASGSVSAYVVERKTEKGEGRLEAHTTGWMAFKSGINRLFHFKSDSDKAANQASLQHLSRAIEQGSNSRVANDVRNSAVFQRALSRGTYVSSELVGKLRDIANEAARKDRGDTGGLESLDRPLWKNVQGEARLLIATTPTATEDLASSAMSMLNPLRSFERIIKA